MGAGGKGNWRGALRGGGGLHGVFPFIPVCRAKQENSTSPLPAYLCFFTFGIWLFLAH